MDERVQAIKRSMICNLKNDIVRHESRAELEGLFEKEAAIQVLNVYISVLESSKLDPGYLDRKQIEPIVRDEILNSFSMELSVQMFCLLRDHCPI